MLTDYYFAVLSCINDNSLHWLYVLPVAGAFVRATSLLVSCCKGGLVGAMTRLTRPLNCRVNKPVTNVYIDV